jgi:hypothetical protein
MSLDIGRLVRSVAIPLVKKFTASAVVDVTVTKASSTDGGGDTTPGDVFTWPAVVDWNAHRVRTSEGIDAMSRATIQFVEPHPLDDDDSIVLPDGTTGPILDMRGVVDPLTGIPYVTTVYLG